MAKKSTFGNMVIVLTAICLVCSAVLGLVYSVTAEPIAAVEAAKINNAIAAVTPAFDNAPAAEAFSIDQDGVKGKVYPAKKGDQIVGYAVEVKSGGFGGPIQMMVGFTTDGVIYNTSVISHAETPGLGAKLSDENIPTRTQLKGLNPATSKISVKKEGGDIDAITASTISSKAFLKGVDLAYQVFLCVQSQN